MLVLPPANAGWSCLLIAAALAMQARAESPRHSTHLPARAAHASHATSGSSGSWSPVGPFGGDVVDVVASPSAPGVVLAGVAPEGGRPGAMYRSIDSGVTWAPVPDLSLTSVYDIAFAQDGTVHAATQDSVWISLDEGVSWAQQPLGVVDENHDRVFTLAIDPGNPEIIWAGIYDDVGNIPEVNLIRSIDGGAHWEDRTTPLQTPWIGGRIAIDPNDSSTVVVAAHTVQETGELWVTANGGDSWDDRTITGRAPLNAVVYDGTRLLAGGGYAFASPFSGIYESTNLGQDWTPLFDESTWPELMVTGIAVDPNDAATILLSMHGTGIYRTTNAGTSWDFSIGGSETFAVHSLRFGPSSSSMIYAGVSRIGVVASTNGGDTFAVSSNGMTELPIVSVAANPTDPLAIAAAHRDAMGGMFTTDDGGGHWRLESAPTTPYNKVGYAPDGTLYAISAGDQNVAPGLYRREHDGSWTRFGPDESAVDIATMAFSRNDSDLILLAGADTNSVPNAAAIWRTIDDGANWDEVHLGRDGDYVTDIEIVEDGTDVTMIASYDGNTSPNRGGALRSIDGGATWNFANTGLPDVAQVPRLCASDANPGVVYLSAAIDATHGGVFRSGDAGASWASTGWAGDRIADIACDPTDAEALYVSQTSGATVERSENQGLTFESFDVGLEAVGVAHDLAFTPGASARLLLATSTGVYATVIPQTLPDEIFGDGFDGL